MQLSRDSITHAALEVLREYGLADVSMRRVATSLGVAPGALYWHIENKQELIASLASAIVEPVVLDPPHDPAQLCAMLRGYVLAVRDGAEIVVAAVGQPDSRVHDTLDETFEGVVRGVAPAQATPGEVRAVAHGLLHLTLGAAAVQQSASQLAAATGDAVGNTAATDDAGLVAEHAEAVRLMLRGFTAGHP